MKCILKPLGFALTLVTFLALITLAVLLTLDFTLPPILKSQVTDRTQYTLDIETTNIAPLQGTVEVKDLTLTNPLEEFELPEFVSINQVKIDLDTSTLLKNTLVINELILDIDNVTFVKNSKGEDNVNTFIERLNKSFGSSPETTGEKKMEDQSSAKNQKHFMIKKLTLRLESIKAGIVLPHRKEPVSSTAKFKWDRTYHNVSDENIAKELSPLSSSLTNKGLGMLTEIIIKGTASIIPQGDKAVDGARTLIKGAGETLKTGVEGTFNSIKGVFGD